MSYQCPLCGKEYDIVLFQFGKKITCECGEVIDATRPRIIKPEMRSNDKDDAG